MSNAKQLTLTYITINAVINILQLIFIIKNKFHVLNTSISGRHLKKNVKKIIRNIIKVENCSYKQATTIFNNKTIKNMFIVLAACISGGHLKENT